MNLTQGPSHYQPPLVPSNISLQVELENVKRELQAYKEKYKYEREHYSVKNMDDEVVCMETGLPNKEVFNIVVKYVMRFTDSINYFAEWKIESIALEDQIVMTPMKVRKNYTNLHLAKLFHCSTATVRNDILTFVHVLHEVLY